MTTVDWPWNAPADGVTPHHVTNSSGTISLYMAASYNYDGVFLGGYRYAYPAGLKQYGGIDQTYNMVDLNGIDHTPELRYELPTDPDLRRDMMDISAYAGKNTEYNFYVRPLGKVSVIARDVDTGQPIPSVSWTYATVSAWTKYTRYDEHGAEFSTYVYGGDTISITASDPPDPAQGRLGHYSETRTVEVGKWESKAIDMAMETHDPGSISGKVTDLSGNGIPDVTVELIWLVYSEDGVTQLVLQTTTTDSDGSYTLTNVVPTPSELTYIVRASKAGWTTDEDDEVDIDSGDDLEDLNLVLALDDLPPFWTDEPEFSVVSVGRTGVLLEWNEAQDDGSVGGYRILQGETILIDTGLNYVTRDDCVRQVVSNLEPSTPYTLTLEAYDKAGNTSIEAPSVSFTTLAPYDPTSKVIRASVSSQGFGGDQGSSIPALSGDGRFVVFLSWSDDLCGSEENRSLDVFLFDRDTGQVQCVSRTSEGETGENSSYYPAISADGRYVAFVSEVDFVQGSSYGNSDVSSMTLKLESCP